MRSASVGQSVGVMQRIEPSQSDLDEVIVDLFAVKTVDGSGGDASQDQTLPLT